MFKIGSAFHQNLKTCSQKFLTLGKEKPWSLPACMRASYSRGRRMRGYDVGRFLLQFKSKMLFPDPFAIPKLSPHEVTSILRLNDAIYDVMEGAVRSFEINKLPSNWPIEDRESHGKLRLNPDLNQYLFGVYDGHSGYACSQALRERLINYVTVALSPENILEKIANGELNTDELVQWYEFGDDQQWQHVDDGMNVPDLHLRKLKKFASESLASFEHNCSAQEHLTSAFVRLDQDITQEGVPSVKNIDFNTDSLEIALSGSCACVAYIDETELYVANVGDCRAVLGSHIGDDWRAIQLSDTHDAQNTSEVRRILSAHANESSNIIKNGRLFGELAPFRAFGDVRYKWTKTEMMEFARYISSPRAEIQMDSDKIMPNNYNTPPYLTAEPQIIHHSLTPKDKFLVIATDGLWDMIAPDKVVRLVAGHMDGNQVLMDPFLDFSKMTAAEINQYLLKRKSSLANRTLDENVATHLIRNALGPEHGQISAFLSLPENISRLYRDDITVLVIFFDSDYIMNQNVSQYSIQKD